MKITKLLINYFQSLMFENINYKIIQIIIVCVSTYFKAQSVKLFEIIFYICEPSDWCIYSSYNLTSQILFSVTKNIYSNIFFKI